MSNMSYCRFRNTLSDLLDCEEALGDGTEDRTLSATETKARAELIKTCARILGIVAVNNLALVRKLMATEDLPLAD